MNEPMLVRRALRGEAAAFEALVAAHQTPVFNLCYRLLGDTCEAEDAAQETFLRAYLKLRQYDPRRSFRNWLLAIAQHCCIDWLRRRRVTWLSLEHPASLASSALSDQRPGPEDLAMERECAEAIQALLEALSPLDRRLVVLRYWNGLSYREMCQVTGTSLGAVKSRLHRARLSMANKLKNVPAGPIAPWQRGPGPCANDNSRRRAAASQALLDIAWLRPARLSGG
jgi:RNA polymerase sigma-70 factor, ECF subfamily